MTSRNYQRIISIEDLGESRTYMLAWENEG